MDDEDLQDIKDSRNLVDTTEEMDFMGGTQKELQGKDDVDESDKEYLQTSYIHTYSWHSDLTFSVQSPAPLKPLSYQHLRIL